MTLYGYYFIDAVDFMHEQLFVFHAEHLGDGGPKDIGIEQPHLIAFAGESHGEIGCDGRFADATFA